MLGIKNRLKVLAMLATNGRATTHAPLAKVSAMNRALVVGDRVLHTPSRQGGTVVGHESIGGVAVITVRLNSGRVIRGIARQELRLGRASSLVVEGPTPVREYVPPTSTDDREFSMESILDELV